MTEYDVLNLGAGVQSTCLYLMSMRGEAPKFDVAIFADTGEEPQAVYDHLAWLHTLNGPKILERSAGSLGNDLMHGHRMLKQGFASIPAFTTANNGVDVGRTRRQCSSEYKIAVIERTIRRDVLGLKPRQRMPKGVQVHQSFGISLDEKSRATRIWERYHIEHAMIGMPHFPLIDRHYTRANCIEWLERYGMPHETPRSACVFCPFHTDLEWQRLKDRGGFDWQRTIEIDQALRAPSAAVNQKKKQTMYLHRSCKPIDEIDFHPRVNVKEQQLGFGVECEGVCGV